MNLPRRVAAEALGTALLLAAVVGSGIMGERLASGNVAIALLANAIATGATLVALILTFGPISGAHFNPAVTLAAQSDWIPTTERCLFWACPYNRMASQRVSRKDIARMSFRVLLRASREPYRRLFSYLRPYRGRFISPRRFRDRRLHCLA